MLAIFPRWFATTKENLHKEKSAKKEPPSPPGGRVPFWLFLAFWASQREKIQIYMHIIWCVKV